MEKSIAVIRGDGIGPEIVGQALRVLDAVGEKFGHTFSYTDVYMGGCAIDPIGILGQGAFVASCDLGAEDGAQGPVGAGYGDGNAVGFPFFQVGAKLLQKDAFVQGFLQLEVVNVLGVKVAARCPRTGGGKDPGQVQGLGPPGGGMLPDL